MAILRIYDGEKWIPIPAIKGDQGEQGVQGEAGKDGKDGISITTAEIIDGELILYFSNNTNINLGNINGAAGEDGVGIENITISESGELSVELTSGTVLNLGNIKGANGTDGINGKDGSDGVGISKMEFNDAGELLVTYTDESSVNLGKAAGIITKTEINDNGELVITYSDNKTETLGRVVGTDGDTPYIGENGNWYIDDTDTEVRAEGNSGVYVGTGEMPDNCNVQIDPSGKETITLPNPHALTFTGAVTGSYDGSTPLTINIPEGTDDADGKTPYIKDGNWWIGETDTGVKAQGADGKSVTIQKVTESLLPGGENVVTFSDGKTLTVRNGEQGVRGKNGNDGAGIESIEFNEDYSLTITTEAVRNGNEIVKDRVAYTSPSLKGEQGEPGEQGESGVYVGSGTPPTGTKVQVNPDGESIEILTAEETRSIITEMLADKAQLTPEYADSLEELEEKGDTSKLYVLPDGHIYAYVKGEGPVYTNQLPISKDTDLTTVYNGVGYITDKYISSGYINDKVGYNTTGLIPIGMGSTTTANGEQVIRLKNIEALPTDAYVRVAFYKADGSFIQQQGANAFKESGDSTASVILYSLDENGYIKSIDVTRHTAYLRNSDKGETAYFRICAPGIDGDSIITVNEPMELTTTVPNFTNQIPISTDTDGSIYDGDGFAENMYLSSGNPGSRNGIDCSGFIPFGYGSSSTASGEQVVRLSGITAGKDTDFRIAFYDANKNYGSQIYGTHFESNSYEIPIPYEVDENGNVTLLDFTAITSYFKTATNFTTAFIRISCPNIDGNSILTVNEEITYTTIEGDTLYKWENTGHAFVPADYEDRIIGVEKKAESNSSRLGIVEETLKGFSPDIEIPVLVKEGASALVDKALSREDSRIIRFLINSDAHQKNDDTLITKGTKELSQAHKAILSQMGVDFVANLGDMTWGSSGSDNATVLEEGKAFNKLFLDSVRGQVNLWTEGNHETGMLTASQIYGLIYAHNKGITQDATHLIEGYGYMDFPNQKVRVICLNTNQVTASENVNGISNEQLEWFAEKALDMSDKTDWSVITLGHHPLSYNTVSLFRYAVETIKAFINGDDFSLTTNDGFTFGFNYGGKNCQYVGHFHGHAHAFSVVKMQRFVASGSYEEIDAWEICIPNACYTRNNQYKDKGEYAERYSTETTYNKADVDGQRTSFNLVTVCLNEKKIYADNYGAGIDRVISY